MNREEYAQKAVELFNCTREQVTMTDKGAKVLFEGQKGPYLYTYDVIDYMLERLEYGNEEER